jgi:hypothetical protein
MSTFPTLAILASLANAGSRAVTIADTVWLRNGKMMAMFLYDDKVRRIVCNDEQWSVHTQPFLLGSSEEARARQERAAEEELRRQAYEHFVLRRSDSCDIVAVLTYERPPTADPAAPKARLLVDYLTAERLSLFLKSPIMDQDCLISRYAGPSEGPWSVVHCVWTDNRLIGVERRVNNNQLNDKRVLMATRMSTTAVEPQHNQPVAVPPGTQARLGKLCAAIAASANAGSPDAAGVADRYGLYFFSSVPLGATKSGRWIFLGANEAPVPRLVGAPPPLLAILPRQQVARTGSTVLSHSPSRALSRSQSQHSPPSRKASMYKDETVSWGADALPPAGGTASSTSPTYFMPRRGVTTPTTVDDGRRRVKPSTPGPNVAYRPLVMTRSATPNWTNRGRQNRNTPLELLPSADVATTLEERSRQRAELGSRGVSTAEWHGSLMDASAHGYLVAPPFARLGRTSPTGLPPVPTGHRAATAPHVGDQTSPTQQRGAYRPPPSRETRLVARPVTTEERIRRAAADSDITPADARASSAVRPVSRDMCVSVQLLKATRNGRDLRPAGEVTYVGRSAFKTSFVDRLLERMDDTGRAYQHEYSAMSPVRNPSGFPEGSPVCPLTSSLFFNAFPSGDNTPTQPSPKESSPMLASQSRRQETATTSLSPRGHHHSNTAVAPPRASVFDLNAKVDAKRQELKSRYDPKALVDVVLDGLYNVYAARLDDPTVTRDVHILSAPIVPQTRTALQLSAGLGGSSMSRSQKPPEQPIAPETLLSPTVAVPLLPMPAHAQLELRALMREVGIDVSVSDALAHSRSTMNSVHEHDKHASQAVAHFPRDTGTASKLKIKLQRLATQIDAHIGRMSIADITNVQREVAESGTGLFHPAVASSMKIQGSSAAAALLLLRK